MPGLLDGRVAIVTGGGRGLGREHAIELARQGARVLVNDLGSELDGSGSTPAFAREVVEIIRGSGGEAAANGDDVSDSAGSARIVAAAMERWGSVHILVNNAGILRDSMIFNMTFEEFDAVIRVHLRGTWAMSHQLARYWRAESHRGDSVLHGRIINTTSPSGLYGNVGQSNYGAAKAAIASLTVIASMELRRYAVNVNCISPGARTRMTSAKASPTLAGVFDRDHPANVSPLVAWLASAECEVTGRVFNVRGGRISVAEPWVAGPAVDKNGRWDPCELGPIVRELVSRARPNSGMDGTTQERATQTTGGDPTLTS